jgi:hypothetical protein
LSPTATFGYLRRLPLEKHALACGTFIGPQGQYLEAGVAMMLHMEILTTVRKRYIFLVENIAMRGDPL